MLFWLASLHGINGMMYYQNNVWATEGVAARCGSVTSQAIKKSTIALSSLRWMACDSSRRNVSRASAVRIKPRSPSGIQPATRALSLDL